MVTQMSKQRTKSPRREICCRDLDACLDPRFFKALCDPSRISILLRLAESAAPIRVSEIARAFPLSVSVVSRHLGMLRDAGILLADKRGKEVFYSVRYPELASMLRSMADAMEACCPG